MSTSVADLLARLPGGAVAPASVALGQLLPILPPLRPLLPEGGLRRGTTIEVCAALPDRPAGAGQAGAGQAGAGQTGGQDTASPAGGGCSLLLALLAGASAAGSWCAAVGVPGLSAAAAAEAGVELSRLALVPDPGAGWARAAAALVDGFDLVAVLPPAGRRAGQAPPGLAADQRALAARVRHHGAVLLSLGPWPGADLRLTATSSTWEGLGDGHGRLRSRRVVVSSGGRGSAGGRPRAVEVLLPSAGAPIAPAASAPPPGLFTEEAV